MEVGKIEFEQASEKTATRFIEKYGNEAWVFGTVDKSGDIHPHRSPKPKTTLLPWECPACGVGVRGDIEVCPNCVKNKTEFKVKTNIQEGEDAGKAVADALRQRIRQTGGGNA